MPISPTSVPRAARVGTALIVVMMIAALLPAAALGAGTVTVTGVSPSSGSTAGGTSVTITGTGFVSGATVSFGDSAAIPLGFIDATTGTATTPAHAAGAVNVVVTNPDTSVGTGIGLYTYVGPTVTGVSPSSGSTAGGTVVTITGTGFVSGATVSFGGSTATSVVFGNATTLTATTPAHAAGAVNVVVTNPNMSFGTGTNLYTYVGATGPTVTINQAAGQADPTGTSPINFTVAFFSAVTGFTTGDVTISGTAGGTKTATVTGSGTLYNVAVTGMTTTGTVIATIPAGVAFDSLSRPNIASTSTDNQVTWTGGNPTVTINQAVGQPDPTNVSPIRFTVVFSASVTGFTTGDVTISGTAGGTKTATVTGSGTTYSVAVTGMTTAGTVVATIPAGVAVDSSSRSSLASTSTDNVVTWTVSSASLTVTPSASVITWGGTVILTVRFSANGANRSVSLLGARDGVTFATIATLTTGTGGTASFAYRPATNLYYKAVFAGAADLGPATSPTVRVVVRQIALLRPTSLGVIRTVARGTTVTFTTTVRPSRPELVPATVTYWVYRKVSGVWTLYATRRVTADSLGLARTTWRFSSAGSWYVRSMANPTPYNANSVKSPVEQYRVL